MLFFLGNSNCWRHHLGYGLPVELNVVSFTAGLGHQIACNVSASVETLSLQENVSIHVGPMAFVVVSVYNKDGAGVMVKSTDGQENSLDPLGLQQRRRCGCLQSILHICRARCGECQLHRDGHRY
jgi:hypothetical protein